MAAPDAIVISLREAMAQMNGLLPPLPGNQRRTILVHALPLRDAPAVLRAITMRNTTWQGHNLNAVRHMADAYVLLGMLSLAALPARGEKPHDNEGNLAWIRDCELQLRQCANVVGGSFRDEAILLCDAMLHHVNTSAQQTLKRVTNLHDSTHTLSEAFNP